MKHLNRSGLLLSLFTTILLTACGGGASNDAYLINGVSLTGCTVPAGTRQSSVIGNIQGQGSLVLDIFPEMGGSIEAYGLLNIPNMAGLAGQLGAGIGATGTSVYGTATLSGGIKSCVSTNGVMGTLSYAGSQQELQIILVGPGGLQIQLSNATTTVVPYISGDRIYGGMNLVIPSYGSLDAIMN